MPSEMPSVNASSTWLCGRVGPQHAHRRQHPPLRADDHHGFFGRVETVLVQRLHRRELAAGAEQDFHVLVGQMAMPGRNADDQLGLPPCAGSPRRAVFQHDLADDLLDGRAV